MREVCETLRCTHKAVRFLCLSVAFVALPLLTIAVAQTADHVQRTAVTPVFIDTDIGDDIDDAYAAALALSSPHVQVVGVSGAWGDTALRAQLLKRLLTDAGKASIPVGAGVPTSSHAKFTQKDWATSGDPSGEPFPDGVELLRTSILRYPGELTLVALGPLTDVAELLRRDPVTFHKLKGIVIMGGSVSVGYQPGSPAVPEYNIMSDASAAESVFAAGVPLSVMPLDSTLVKLSPDDQSRIFAVKSPLSVALKELTREWSGNGNAALTLYDAVPVAILIDPAVCPVRPMTLRVDSAGYTRKAAGPPNVEVCTSLDEKRFRSLVFHSLAAKK